MNIDSRVQLSLLLITTLGIGWSAGYYSRGDRIETLNSELNSYKQAEKLNLAQTVNQLEQVNSQVLNNVNEIRSYTDWKKNKKILETKTSELASVVKIQEKKIKNSTNNIDKLNKLLIAKQAQIDSLYPVNELFWLAEKTTKTIAGFEGILGLKGVYSNYVNINYANKEYRLHAGNYVEANVKGSTCKIILSAIDYGANEKAQFRTVCKKI